MRTLLIDTALNRPRLVVVLTFLITLGFLTQFPRIQIDTDPENMLPESESVRVFHRQLKETFGIRDFLVLGIVREDGMFAPEPLARVAAITEEIAELDGVIVDDLIAPTEVDDISVGDDGTLRVAPLMEEPPADAAGGAAMLERIRQNPMLRGKLASDDGRAIALFIPLESKNVSYEVSAEVSAIAEKHGVDETFYLAGQPVAQDTFGAEMFKQMAVFAPLAGLVLFLVMLFFFRNLRMVGAAMILAFVSVIWGMGALIGLGFTVHIMSSMIPIFLLPIAILDAIHILSDMQEAQRRGATAREAIRESLYDLFRPMLFTTITTMVGFASLLLTPIPPVQVFGAFVAFGIGVAWFLSMTFLPALAVLGSRAGDRAPGDEREHEAAAGGLQWVRRLAMSGRRPIAAGALAIFALSLVGLTRLQVNDNPVRWFKGSHPLRVADRVMNDHLAGTYLAYIQLGGDDEQLIHEPEVMQYIEGLQSALDAHANVGATTSVADIVKKVGYELHLEEKGTLVVPDDRQTIAQYLFLYEISGGDPEDLFHFITPGGDKANVWVQMRAGDNAAVQSVVDAADAYFAANPLPAGVAVDWAGLSYINVIWQDLMVKGMGKALMGSFVVVFLMMTALFRSLAWGLVSMLPLSGTIGFTYGMLGWVGRDYDMPVAVLSSLSLGLSIDFAIHFIQRSRQIHRETNDYEETMMQTFGNTGRAIFLNMLVLAAGFVPMFFASLTPYVTVGLLFFLIIMVSGSVTLVLLPAVTAFRPRLFYPPAGSPSRAAAAAVGIAVLAAAIAPGAAQADGLDATSIMKTAHINFYYAEDDGIAKVSMSLVDKRGREREREFIMLRWDAEDGGEQRYYTYFEKPADVRRTTFMVIKHQGADDDRWIYVPAVDLVRRISANDKSSSFVGSDFSYEDVSGRHWSDDEHEMHGEDVLDERPVYVIKSTPTDGADWSYRLSYVDKERMLPLREEYFDDKGEMVRLFTADEIQEIDGVMTVTQRTMRNLKKERHTVVRFSEVRYNAGIEPDLFTERYLKSPPREYIR